MTLKKNKNGTLNLYNLPLLNKILLYNKNKYLSP